MIYPSLTKNLLDRVVHLQWRDGGPDMLEQIKHCVLDWLAVSIAATRDPSASILRDELEAQGGYPQATAFGCAQHMSTHQAALFNGTLSHLFDFDDTNFAIPGHVTSPILSALLPIAEHQHATASVVMDALLTGYEASCRIALLLAPGHYTRGFHATATIGCLGAAVACARLLGLDLTATAHALGIAATRAAGLKSMFGTPCKPLHVGMAASAGQLAASLAARGFESREDVLECPQGFAATHSPDFNPEAAMRDPASGYHIYNNLFKFHASCYVTHATIECGQHIRKSDGFSLDDVLAINVRANTHCDEICNIAEPKTGMETKFSLRAAAAFSLAGLDTSRPEVFSDTNARLSVLSGLRDKVTVQLTPDLVLTESEVEVELRSGKMIHARRDTGVPMKDRAAQGRRVAEKFHFLVEPIVGKIRSKQIHLEVNQLEELSDIAPLMALCQKI